LWFLIQKYGKGSCVGYWSKDSVAISEFSVKSADLLLVYKDSDFDSLSANGILGLSNDINDPNIFDLGFKAKVLVNPYFAFEIKRDSDSYFYFNETINENDTVWINCVRTNFWVPLLFQLSQNIPVLGLSIGDQDFSQYARTETLVDSGTSLILFP